jgi:hypothetical protein
MLAREGRAEDTAVQLCLTDGAERTAGLGSLSAPLETSLGPQGRCTPTLKAKCLSACAAPALFSKRVPAGRRSVTLAVGASTSVAATRTPWPASTTVA